MLCNLSGPFEKMVEKDFWHPLRYPMFYRVKLVTVLRQLVLRVSLSEKVRLNLKYLLGYDQELEIDQDIRSCIHLKNLPTKGGKVNPLYAERPLGEMWTKIHAGVKKLMAAEKNYMVVNGQLPSGDAGPDNLLDHIWTETWKQHKFDEARKKQIKDVVKADGSATVDSQEDQDLCVPDDFDAGILKTRRNGSPHPLMSTLHLSVN